MEVMENREIFLPYAVQTLFKRAPEETRQEMLQHLENTFDQDQFDQAIFEIRQSNFADQVEKILRIFQQCLVVGRSDDDDEYSWILGIPTELIFQYGDDSIRIEVMDDESGTLRFPIDATEADFMRCPICKDDDYIPIIPDELRYHTNEYHPDFQHIYY